MLTTTHSVVVPPCRRRAAACAGYRGETTWSGSRCRPPPRGLWGLRPPWRRGCSGCPGPTPPPPAPAPTTSPTTTSCLQRDRSPTALSVGVARLYRLNKVSRYLAVPRSRRPPPPAPQRAELYTHARERSTYVSRSILYSLRILTRHAGLVRKNSKNTCTLRVSRKGSATAAIPKTPYFVRHTRLAVP